MNKILRLFEFIKYYIFTIFSNIDPSKNIKFVLFIFLKSAYYNLKYSFKNIFKPSNNIKFNFSRGNYWDRCANHLNFTSKYYDTNQIHKAPVVSITTWYNSPFNKNLKDNYFLNEKINKFSKILTDTFDDINYSDTLYWYGQFYHSLISDIISEKQKEYVNNCHVLEIGPGLGLNSLFYSDFNSRDIYYYDLYSMTLLQKRIENLLNKNNKINKIIYHDKVKSLEQDLISKDYYIISRYAFSEFPLNLRNEFEKIIKNSKFSLFLSNTEFENIKNENYFQSLAKNINKNLTIKNFYYPEQDPFTKKHNFYILHD